MVTVILNSDEDVKGAPSKSQNSDGDNTDSEMSNN
jgi:hypothetical protein